MADRHDKYIAYLYNGMGSPLGQFWAPTMKALLEELNKEYVFDYISDGDRIVFEVNDD